MIESIHDIVGVRDEKSVNNKMGYIHVVYKSADALNYSRGLGKQIGLAFKPHDVTMTEHGDDESSIEFLITDSESKDKKLVLGNDPTKQIRRLTFVVENKLCSPSSIQIGFIHINNKVIVSDSSIVDKESENESV